MSNDNGAALVVTAGVVAGGLVVASAVSAMIAAITALISTILMVAGIVAGVAVLGLVLPGIIRALGDVHTQRELATNRPAVAPLELGASSELKQLRDRLQALEAGLALPPGRLQATPTRSTYRVVPPPVDLDQLEAGRG